MSGIAPLIALTFLGGGHAADVPPRESFPSLIDLNELNHCYVAEGLCGVRCVQFVATAGPRECDRHPAAKPRIIPLH